VWLTQLSSWQLFAATVPASSTIIGRPACAGAMTKHNMHDAVIEQKFEVKISGSHSVFL